MKVTYEIINRKKIDGYFHIYKTIEYKNGICCQSIYKAEKRKDLLLYAKENHIIIAKS